VSSLHHSEGEALHGVSLLFTPLGSFPYFTGKRAADRNPARGDFELSNPSRSLYPEITYRPDIDGLRAIAVLSVVAFHAFPRYFPSGFIGVDIFFVISGYLITSLIIRHLALDDVSFLDFYQRRIRRIFPALILVLFSCLVFGSQVLYRDQFGHLSEYASQELSRHFSTWAASNVPSLLTPLVRASN
jgi:peptidoglycan/LPS O-acetylase OafA/YrhL